MSLEHHHILGSEPYIGSCWLDWKALIPSFFNPSQPCQCRTTNSY